MPLLWPSVFPVIIVLSSFSRWEVELMAQVADDNRLHRFHPVILPTRK